MKIYPLLIMLAISPSVLASHSMTSPAPFNGFYVTGGLGGTTGQFDLSQELVMNVSGLGVSSINQSTHHDARATQFAGILGMGYSYQLDSLWVGSLEFTAGFTGATASFHNDSNLNSVYTLNSKVESTLKNDFALVVKPGLIINRYTQFYALLGTRWGNFETKTSSQAIANTDSSSGSNSKSAYVIGFTVGIGVERFFTDHWSLGLEYAYTTYGDIPDATNQYASGTIASVTNEVTGTASSNNLMLDVRYRF